MSKKLDLSFIMSYIASWGERFEKSIMINLLRQVNENNRLELCQMHYLWQSKSGGGTLIYICKRI